MKTFIAPSVSFLSLAGGLLGTLALAPRADAQVVLASSTLKGAPQISGSEHPTVSADGRYVAFDSYADLAETGVNLFRHVYIKELTTGLVRRVSVNAKGEQGNGESFGPALSSDGRYVAFTSLATNLVANDTNDQPDIFVKDLATGTVQRINVSATGEQANGQSGIWEKQPFSPGVAISADGKEVGFVSLASNLVPGDTNKHWDVFVKNLVNGVLQRVSVSATGVESNSDSFDMALSAQGRTVAFTSYASNLVPGFASGDTEVFVKDLVTGAIQRVSQGPKGELPTGNSDLPSLSADGRVVVFYSYSTNLTADPITGLSDVYRMELPNGPMTRVSVTKDGSPGNNNSFDPEVTADGRYVVFNSYATNLSVTKTPNSDIFLKDTVSGNIGWLSTPPNLVATNGNSIWPAISATGRIVVFASTTSNLVANDINGATLDVFLVGTGLGLGVPHSGDITGDGIVDVRDAIQALLFAVGLVVPRQDEITSGDLTYDGHVTTPDVILILQKAAGIKP